MKPERLRIIENQQRSYCEGILELINGEWVFFDEENDDAFPLEDFFFKEIQFKQLNQWHTGILTEDYVIQSKHTQYILQDQMRIRIRKSLPFSCISWLEELQNDVFYQFFSTLNQLNFSIFDILYCHNFLSFIFTQKKQGVNFLTFDNSEEICVVQHHFDYDVHKRNDRLEFTLNTGKRVILQDFYWPKNT